MAWDRLADCQTLGTFPGGFEGLITKHLMIYKLVFKLRVLYHLPGLHPDSVTY